MFCKSCGNELKNDDKFCSNCGSRTEPDLSMNSSGNTVAENTTENNEPPKEILAPAPGKCQNGHLYDTARYGDSCPYCKNTDSIEEEKVEQKTDVDFDVTRPLNRVPQAGAGNIGGHPDKTESEHNPIVNPVAPSVPAAGINSGAHHQAQNTQTDSNGKSSEGGRTWKILSVLCLIATFAGVVGSLTMNYFITSLLFVPVFVLALPIRKMHRTIKEKTKATFGAQLFITMLLFLWVFIFWHFVITIDYMPTSNNNTGATVSKNDYTETEDYYGSESISEFYSEPEESTFTTQESTENTSTTNKSGSNSITDYFTIPDVNVVIP